MANVNQRLYDAMVRHQVYLDGLKEGQLNEFDIVLREIAKNATALINAVDKEKMDELTRGAVLALIAKLRKVQTRLYTQHGKNLLQFLEEFTAVDYDLRSEIIAKLMTAEGFGTAGMVTTAAALWKVIQTTPISTGDMPVPFLKNFGASGIALLERLILRSTVERWTKKQLIDEIVGAKGLLQRVRRNFAATANTLIEHVGSRAVEAASEHAFERYQWISVMDEVTSDICTVRNNRIYIYGEGPIPPAHINCRSDIAPIFAGDTVPNRPRNYHAWLKQQPPEVLDDILGKAVSKAVRDGDTRALDFSKADYRKPLTLEEFRAKSDLITAE